MNEEVYRYTSDDGYELYCLEKPCFQTAFIVDSEWRRDRVKHHIYETYLEMLKDLPSNEVEGDYVYTIHHFKKGKPIKMSLTEIAELLEVEPNVINWLFKNYNNRMRSLFEHPIITPHGIKKLQRSPSVDLKTKLSKNAIERKKQLKEATK